MKNVVVTGDFDNLGARHVRFLEAASRYGNLHVGLWSDETIQALEGKPPKFPERERLYLVQSIRFVDQVTLIQGGIARNALPQFEGVRLDRWVVDEAHDTPESRAQAEAQGLEYGVLSNADLAGFSVPRFAPPASDGGRKRAIVTGCFDWFHSGHVRFFEEVSALGELYVVVGHDANITLLKGEGHPLFSQEHRLYMVHSVRYVHQAWLSTGHGWMDAAPEVALIKPHLYVANEDGDQPEKRAFCAEHGIEYVVLKRVPKPGLPRRQSTALRGF
jgi:cytidyltransferase-like protein